MKSPVLESVWALTRPRDGGGSRIYRDSILLRVSLAVSLEITALVLNGRSMSFNIFINDLFLIECLICAAFTL